MTNLLNKFAWLGMAIVGWIGLLASVVAIILGWEKFDDAWPLLITSKVLMFSGMILYTLQDIQDELRRRK